MASRRTVAAEPAPEVVEVVEDLEGEEPEDIAQLLGTIGGDVSRVGIHRRNPQTRKLEFLDTVDLDTFGTDLTWLRDVWGGGDYQLKFLGAGNRYIRAHSVQVAGAPKVPREFSDPEPERVRAEPVTPREDPNAVTAVLVELIRELRESRAESHANPLQLAVDIGKMVSEQTRALVEGLRPAETERTSLSEGLEVLKMGMDLGAKMGGAGGTDGMLMELGGELLKTLAEARGGGRPDSGPKAAPAGGPEAQADAPGWVPLLRPWVPHLIGWAKQGKDPSLYADFVADQIPDALVDEIAAPGFLANFLGAFPSAQPHQWWFERFVSIITGATDADAEGEAVDVTETEATQAEPPAEAGPGQAG